VPIFRQTQKPALIGRSLNSFRSEGLYRSRRQTGGARVRGPARGGRRRSSATVAGQGAESRPRRMSDNLVARAPPLAAADFCSRRLLRAGSRTDNAERMRQADHHRRRRAQNTSRVSCTANGTPEGFFAPQARHRGWRTASRGTSRSRNTAECEHRWENSTPNSTKRGKFATRHQCTRSIRDRCWPTQLFAVVPTTGAKYRSKMRRNRQVPKPREIGDYGYNKTDKT